MVWLTWETLRKHRWHGGSSGSFCETLRQRENSEAELFRDRIGADPKVVTKDDVLLCVRHNTMNDAILTGEGLRVEQRGERIRR